MAEIAPYSLDWVERLPPPVYSQILLIRHGESEYTKVGYDLTVRGVMQIENTARKLKKYLNNFNCVFVISSPAARAKGSFLTFWETSGIKPSVHRFSRYIRPSDIKNPGYIDYLNKNSTSNFGEIWMTDEKLQTDNELVESRPSTESRSVKYIDRLSKTVNLISKSEGKKIAVLMFAHFETGMPFLSALFEEESKFPFDKCVATQNAEPIIIQLDDIKTNQYTLIARGISKQVILTTSSKKIK